MATMIQDNIQNCFKTTSLLVLPASATVVGGKLACTSPELAFFDNKFKDMSIKAGNAILTRPFPKGYGTIRVSDRAAIMQVHTEHHEAFTPIVAGYSLYALAHMAAKEQAKGNLVDLLYPKSLLIGDDVNIEVRKNFNACIRMLLPDNVRIWSDYE